MSRSAAAEHKSDPVKTSEKILRVAADLFCEFGYTAASISKIAKEAEVLPGSIYWAFQSKEHLFAEVLKSSADRWLLANMPEDGHSQFDFDDLVSSSQAMTGAFQGGPTFVRLMLIVATERKAGDPEILATVRNVRRSSRQNFHNALAIRYPSWDPSYREEVATRLSRMILQLLDGIFISQQLEPDEVGIKEMLGDFGHMLQLMVADAALHAEVGKPAAG